MLKTQSKNGPPNLNCKWGFTGCCGHRLKSWRLSFSEALAQSEGKLEVVVIAASSKVKLRVHGRF
jgi:hypothetical protein